MKRSDFRDPGGRSALRAGKRIHPCPTCGRKNQLTAEDKRLGYQCDVCADAVEGHFDYPDYGSFEGEESPEDDDWEM